MIYLCKSYIWGLNGYVFLNVFAVEAYVASWIEIPYACAVAISTQVEAYVASWIEILAVLSTVSLFMSRLM